MQQQTTKKIKLKICGMKETQNINAVSQLHPEYLGFIFYENSSRFVDTDIPEVDCSIKKTGVFVNASFAFILDKIKRYGLKAVQLHGNESPEFCEKLKSHFEKNNEFRQNNSIELIKVFSIINEFDFTILKAFEPVCDYFLFDTKGKLPGGNGYTFNWNVLKDYPSTKPYFLSGGIGLNEIKQIQEFLNKKEAKYCYAIDVNSKFEIEPGLKNIKQLKEFKTQL